MRKPSRFYTRTRRSTPRNNVQDPLVSQVRYKVPARWRSLRLAGGVEADTTIYGASVWVGNAVANLADFWSIDAVSARPAGNLNPVNGVNRTGPEIRIHMLCGQERGASRKREEKLER